MPTFVTRTVGDVVSEILMSRSAFAGSFLVLEGDTDSKFWSRRISGAHCQIVIAGSKPTVSGAVIGANNINQLGILGVVDDDYDSLCGIPLPSTNVLRTETRDLECLLLRSNALETVVHELGDAYKIRNFEQAEGVTVREALVRRSILFGKLRWLDRLQGWKYSFDGLSPWRFANEANWSIDEAGVTATISGRLGISVLRLQEFLDALPPADPYAILHGRDTVNVLAIGLRNRIGGQQHRAERICQMLRLAFDQAIANATMLFQQVRSWESANNPYRVLS